MRHREYFWSLNDCVEKNQVDDLRTDQVEAIFAVLPKDLRINLWIWREGFSDWQPFAEFPQLLLSLRKVEHQVLPTPPVKTTPFNATDPVSASPPEPIERPIDRSKDVFKDLSKERRAKAAVAEVKVDTSTETTQATQPTNIATNGSTASNASIETNVTKVKGANVATVATSATTASSATNVNLKSKEKIKQFELEKNDEFSFSIEKTRMSDDRENHRFNIVLEVRVIAGEKVYKNSTVNVSLKGMQLKLPLPPGLPRYFNIEIKQKNYIIPLVCTEVKNAGGGPSSRVKIEVNDRSPELLTLLLAG